MEERNFPRRRCGDNSDSCLQKLKDDYILLQEKYNLPLFEQLNDEFQVERVSDIETDYILREMKKVIADKMQNYLRFLEAILNPTEASMFIFMIVKSVNSDDKKKLTDIYKKLAKVNFDLVELDIVYSEEKEAEFIKKSYVMWEGIKNEMFGVLNSISKNWGNGIEFQKSDYLG